MAHILVVDDDKDILNVVSKLLERKGHSVVTCIDPLDAVDRWNMEHFDLVLTDANMPHINGFDLTKTFSKNARGLGTTIALLTARRDKKDVELAMKNGADDYIVKPIDPDIFFSKVDSLLAKSSANLPEIQFVESQIRMYADWKPQTEIVSISEYGMTLLSPILAAKNSKFFIQSDLYKSIGIESPMLRVLDCQPDPSGNMKFITKVTFVGMADTEQQKIRFWVNSNLGFYKSKSAA